jgi:nucleotide-binding universal stress UspA family protein
MNGPQIIVAVDGSANGRSALLWAADECHIRDCSLLIVHAANVMEMGHGPAADEVARRTLRAADQLLTARATLASARQPTVAVSTLLAHAESGETLIDLSLGAVMLVLGAQRRPPLRGEVVGAVTRRVTAQSHCPVAVVPPRSATATINGRVLVAALAGPSGRRAREFGHEEALVRAASMENVGLEERDAIETVLSQSRQAQLVVLGVYQAGALRSMQLDPAAAAVLCHSWCPIVVVSDEPSAARPPKALIGQHADTH